MYDVYEVRKLFPMLNSGKLMQNNPLVFLDNSSTTFKPQMVIDAITKYYAEQSVNAHRGDYDLCYAIDQEVLKTRQTIAKFVNCEPNEVVFTSGDTMAINLIAYGYGEKYLQPGDEIIISESEHASNVLPWYRVAKNKGAIIKFIPLDEEGRVTPENLLKVISSHTKIVALAHVSNVLGYVVDIEKMAQIAHKFGAIICVDGAQSVPHFKTDFMKWDIDFLVFSAHKMCGPTGIGCVIGKHHLLEMTDPFILGGGMNENFDTSGQVSYLHAPEKFEAGTQHIAGIIGFKAAIEFIESLGIDNIQKHEVEIKKYAISELEKIDNVIIYNKNAESGIITFNLKDVFAQDEGTLLNSKGIAVRTGQHCDKLLNNFLHTPATCRASIYLYTTKEDIDALVNTLKQGGNILDAYFND